MFDDDFKFFEPTLFNSWVIGLALVLLASKMVPRVSTFVLSPYFGLALYVSVLILFPVGSACHVAMVR